MKKNIVGTVCMMLLISVVSSNELQLSNLKLSGNDNYSNQIVLSQKNEEIYKLITIGLSYSDANELIDFLKFIIQNTIIR